MYFVINTANMDVTSWISKNQNISQSAGFEPARAEPNRFLVYRLNHSATTADDHIYNRTFF